LQFTSGGGMLFLQKKLWPKVDSKQATNEAGVDIVELLWLGARNSWGKHNRGVEKRKRPVQPLYKPWLAPSLAVPTGRAA
jgi:hypothetical protein